MHPQRHRLQELARFGGGEQHVEALGFVPALQQHVGAFFVQLDTALRQRAAVAVYQRDDLQHQRIDRQLAQRRRGLEAMIQIAGFLQRVRAPMFVVFMHMRFHRGQPVLQKLFDLGQFIILNFQPQIMPGQHRAAAITGEARGHHHRTTRKREMGLMMNPLAHLLALLFGRHFIESVQQ
ncbi:MAG: hypothetical protein ALAOOOJD_03358 [bacterium]|nr:hypothetical protein [bacterium]